MKSQWISFRRESNQDALARVLKFLMELEERYSRKNDFSWDFSTTSLWFSLIMKMGADDLSDCFLIDRNGIVKELWKIGSLIK